MYPQSGGGGGGGQCLQITKFTSCVNWHVGGDADNCLMLLFVSMCCGWRGGGADIGKGPALW